MRTLDQYLPFTDELLKLCIEKHIFHSTPDLPTLFSTHPRLIVVCNHSSPLSWLPVPLVLTHEACAAGFGHRRPLSIMDKFFFDTPILKPLAHYLTQSDRPLTFDELLAHFVEMQDMDLLVFPEGSNCFFGPPEEIQEFRSSRFIELAVRTQTPILLCVHRGSESWGRTFQLQGPLGLALAYAPDFLQKRLIQSGGLFSVPWVPKKIPLFQMCAKLYQPTLNLSNLAVDLEERQQQIVSEGKKVREQMMQILQSLDNLEEPVIG